MPAIRRFDAVTAGFMFWLVDRDRPPARSTCHQYRRRIARARRLAHPYSLFEADERTIRLILGRLSPHPSTQAAYLSTLRIFFDFTVSTGLRTHNPARMVLGSQALRLVEPSALEASHG